MHRWVYSFLLILVGNSLYAQEADQPIAPKNMEKLEVTGSYIKRIDTEGPSPVITFDRESLDKAGVNTISDYIRESPMFTGSQDNGNRDGYFEFRGQHAGSTLVLINGMRVPKLGGPDRGFYSGVENIPTNIVERTEVLKDGSSALYGSDAMAGVMNFITRKDYDGAEYSTRVNVPEINKGLEQNHTLTFGKTYSRGSWFMSTQFVEQRAYTEADIGSFYRNSAPPGSMGTMTTLGAKRESTDFQKPCANGATGRDCPVDFRSIDYVRNGRQNIGTLMSGRYDINSNVSISVLGIYNNRRRTDIGRPNFINISQKEGDAPMETSKLTSNAMKAAAAGGGDLFEFSVMPYDEVGLDQVAVEQNSYSAQSKIEGYYLDTWRWDLTGSYAYSLEQRNHRNGLVDKDIVRDIVYASPNYSLNGTNTDAFRAARVQGVEAYRASMTSARLLTTGELFDLNSLWGAGGPVSMAVGVEGQWETTADAHDSVLFQKNLNQNFEPNQQGGRTVNSVFTEFAIYPVQQVELQLAGRYDRYSDFGDTFNPKVSLGYRPTQKVLLRSSWGTNFNAPSVRNMIQRDMIRYEDIQIGPQGGNPADAERSTIAVTRYRDPRLREEKGVNYNFGAVLQANKNWSFSIDQWNFLGQGSIAQRSAFDYSDLYYSIGEQELASEAGVTFERDATGKIIAARMPQVSNMGTRIIRGLDLNATFHSPVRLFGKVMKATFRSDQTHMMLRKTKYTQASAFVNYADLEWKNNTSFALSTLRHTYRVAIRTLPGDTGTRYQTRTQSEYDFNYRYQIPFWTASFTLGVKNLLNTRPPVDRSGNFIDFTAGLSTDEFLPIGRRYYVGYEQAF